MRVRRVQYHQDSMVHHDGHGRPAAWCCSIIAQQNLQCFLAEARDIVRSPNFDAEILGKLESIERVMMA